MGAWHLPSSAGGPEPATGSSASINVKQQKFFSSNIPFMRTASKLMVALNVSEIDANTEVNLYLECSFDGINWVAVETLTAGAATATGVTLHMRSGPVCGGQHREVGPGALSWILPCSRGGQNPALSSRAYNILLVQGHVSALARNPCSLPMRRGGQDEHYPLHRRGPGGASTTDRSAAGHQPQRADSPPSQDLVGDAPGDEVAAELLELMDESGGRSGGRRISRDEAYEERV
jgi:hypothetical protein